MQLTGKIIRQQGITALYNGLSASLMRQLTYSTTRFGIYEVGKQTFGDDLGFGGKVLLAGSAGAAGGLVGTPADLVIKFWFIIIYVFYKYNIIISLILGKR